MGPQKEENLKKAEGCSLFWTGDKEPVSLVSEILRRSGVKIGKIDKKNRQIFGRIGSRLESHSCKVTARIYNQKEMSLVSLMCEGSWRRPGTRVLCDYVDVLCKNFDDVSLSDVVNSIDWESHSDGKSGHRITTDAVALLRDMEAELGWG